jgi:hypothetical protein
MKKFITYVARWLPMLLQCCNNTVKQAACLFATLCFWLWLPAQPNITRVEYYIDTDPGYGHGTAISIVPAVNLDGLSFNISMAALSQGVHIVGVRSKDAKGAWSLDNRWLFLKPYSGSAATPVPNITRVEYYIDNDPGYGNATALSITPATNIASLAINISLTPLNSGVHIVGVRSRDAHGAWSLDNRWPFLKPYAVTGATTPPNINRVEYYIDNDPGYGHGTALSFTIANNLSNLSFIINIGPLKPGVHIVGVRSRDAHGAWSLDNKWIFLKPYAAGKTAIIPKIERVEYYVDNDPGYGHAIGLAITPSTNLASLSFNINLAPLAQGVHIVGVRSLDSNGAWGLDNRWLFVKPYATGTATPQPNIVRLEYYVDVDPGYGHATAVPIVAGKDLANQSFAVNIASLANGPHFIGVRSKDANGAWSLDNKYAITISGHFATVAQQQDKIAIDSITTSLKLQYNPVHNQAILLYATNKDDKIGIRVMDNLGRAVITKQVQVFTGINVIQLNTATMAQGIYTVQAINTGQALHVKMMKQ